MKKSFNNYLFLICTLIFSIISTNVYAAEDIQVILEQPAVYSAAPGDKLKYTLNVKLPKDYENKYKSFAITVLMDNNLEVKNTELKDIKLQENKISVKTTNLTKSTQNLVTFTVSETKLLNKKEDIKLDINTEVKKGVKGDNLFKNSFVLTYTDRAGKEESDPQKDLVSNTSTNGLLNVNEVFSNSKEIKGTTEKNASLKVFLGEEIISEGKSNDKGEFSLKITPQKEGTEIKIVSYFKKDAEEKNSSKEIVVKEEKIETTDLLDKEESSEKVDVKKYNMTVLKDFLNMADDLNVDNASKEDYARLKAAIANGEYIKVKSKVLDVDYKNAIDKLEEAIKYIRKPYMTGYKEDKFGPNDKMTRAQTAVVLSRIIKDEELEGYYSSFKDVKQDKWYAEAIGFMEEKEILKGYKDKTFKPEKSITRAEFASLVSKIIDAETEKDSIEFKDLKENHWAKDDIDTMTSLGIMNGRTKDTFAPNEEITRAEVAKVLNKIQKKEINKDFIDNYSKNPFTDVKKGFWAYYDILEITAN
ncbi:S-layer homology domain-containing protein [Peptoniphilus stercorisuis]|uniref:RNA-binding protein n=1 Tax=Peptoniphilus stercorisuis TaxID=1436965 RepID=A0ABS4KCB9_9FIRM|nr:S-layer homology domain-containing protein [Peptoniphilus stercorisuis]MBP2024811.1 putative RNA-binding protein [Peptoniphilus stercorisuis]